MTRIKMEAALFAVLQQLLTNQDKFGTHMFISDFCRNNGYPLTKEIEINGMRVDIPMKEYELELDSDEYNALLEFVVSGNDYERNNFAITKLAENDISAEMPCIIRIVCGQSFSILELA